MTTTEVKWGKLSSVNRKSVDQDFDLFKDLITIGRGEQCDIRIENQKISKVHCEISRDESGNVFIEDKSSNGTHIYDKLIGKDTKKVQINSGDIIYLLHRDKIKGKYEDVGLVYSSQATLINSQSTAKVDPVSTPSAAQVEVEKKLNDEIGQIKQKLKEEREKKKQLAEELGEDFKCGICCEYIYDCATVSPCLHNFCAGCLSELFLQPNQNCPLCRDPMQTVKKNAQINGVVDKFIHKSPHFKRMPEEYEECDHKNVIKAATSSVSELQRLMKSQCNSNAYQTKLQDIRERLNKRMNKELDSDYSYQSDDDDCGDKSSDIQIKPDECPECQIPRLSDGFKCGKDQSHLSCKACQRKFPDRESIENQRCILCQDAYCGLYLGVCRQNLSSAQNKDKYLSKFSDFQAPQKIASQIFRNNKSELIYLDDYMKSKKISTADILSYMNENFVSKGKFYFEKSSALLQNYSSGKIRTIINADSPICSFCFAVVWHQVVFRYRIAIKHDLPAEIANRPMCHWGINCTTQVSKPSHADRFDHIDEQRRF